MNNNDHGTPVDLSTADKGAASAAASAAYAEHPEYPAVALMSAAIRSGWVRTSGVDGNLRDTYAQPIWFRPLYVAMDDETRAMQAINLAEDRLRTARHKLQALCLDPGDSSDAALEAE